MSRNEHRFLLNIAYGGGSDIQLSLRDTEDGNLRTFSRFPDLVSFLEAEVGAEVAADVETPAEPDARADRVGVND